MAAYGVKPREARVCEAGAWCVSVRPRRRKPDEATAMSASAPRISPWRSARQSGECRLLCQLHHRVHLTGLSC